jgi:CRP-like cAMP-binding protein
VRGWGLCEPIHDDELDVVERFKAGDKVLEAGQDLFREGEPSRELYTVLEGWMFLYKLLEDGRRQIAKIVLPGDFVGFQPDLEALLDHSAQALTDVRLCVFPRDNFLELNRAHPELAIRLTCLVAHDVEMSRDRLTSVGRRSARERVAHFLLGLFYRVRLRHQEPRGASIPMPLTQEHIGDALGLTSVHVNRTLRNLRDEGLIEIANRRLHILDPDRLADAAGFDEDSLGRT